MAELILLSRDQNRSAEERLKFVDEASRLEKANLTDQIRLQEEQVRILRERNILGESSRDDVRAQTGAEAELERLRRDSLNRERELENRRITLQNEISRDQVARAKEAAEQQKNDRLAVAYDEAREFKRIANEEFQLGQESFQLAKRNAEDVANVRIAAKEKEVEAEKRLNQVKLEADQLIAQQRIALAANTLGAVSQFAKEGTALQKAAAVASASYQTYVAANQALANPPGPPYTIPFKLAAIVSGLANVKEILKLKMGGLVPISSNSLATNVVKAERGTILRGASHANGGIPVMVRNRQVAEAEGGEIVLTKNVSKSPAFLALASTLNQLAGGRALTTRKYMATGGAIATSTSQVRAQTSQNRTLNQLNETLTNKKQYVAVSDIRRTESEMIDVEQKRTV